MKKYKFIFAVVLTSLLVITSQFVFAQTCTNDPDDPGNCDTLWIEQENGRIQPNTTVIRHVWGYHDEILLAWSIPIRYKNPQTDIYVDSVKLKNLGNCPSDIVVDTSAGTILLFSFCDFGGMVAPGTDTFAIVYFRTGPSWDPSIHNALDTYSFGGQGLSFVDTATNDIQPVYDPPGNLDAGDDPKGQSAKPKSFLLYQNYPNPFNTETVISFTLPRSSHVKIEIFNILGQKVRDLVDQQVSTGFKQAVWDGKDNAGKPVASGVYLYQLSAGELTETKRMTLLK